MATGMPWRWLGLALLTVAACTTNAPEERAGAAGEALITGTDTFGSRRAASQLHPARSRFAMVRLLDGRLLLTGGLYDGVTPLRDTWLFDPGHGWQQGPNLNVARYDHVLSRLPGTELVMVAGGAPGAGDDTAEIFNPVSPAAGWASIQPMHHARQGAAAAEVTQGVLIVGGTAETDVGEVWDTADHEWIPTPPMGIVRDRPTATPITGGAALVVGGAAAASAQVYDHNHYQWLPAGAMASPRSGHRATWLSTGAVLITGGEGPNGSLTTVEIWRSGEGFRPTASLRVGRAHHTATSLWSGEVVVTGGETSPGAATREVEIYDPIGETWTRLTPLSATAAYHAAERYFGLQGNEVFTLGGEQVAPNAPLTPEIVTPPVKRCETRRATSDLSVDTVGNTSSQGTLLYVSDTFRSALQIPLGAHGTGARVTSATVTLKAQASNQGEVDVGRLLAPWQNTHAAPSFAPVTSFEAKGTSTFGLMYPYPLAQLWVDDPTQNRGLILQSAGADATFWSSEAGAFGPSLQICTYTHRDPDQCEIAQCDAGTDTCTYVAKADGTACNADDDACTGPDICVSGTCRKGAVIDPDDHDICTIDSCDHSKGPQHTPRTDPPCNGVCLGEVYDVNGSLKDGCEIDDPMKGHHSFYDRLDVGAYPCTAGPITIDGRIPSDARQHPDIAGFDPSTGAAPDWYLIHACFPSLRATLSVWWPKYPSCYQLWIGMYGHENKQCVPDDSGSCRIDTGFRLFTGEIAIGVSKTCSAALQEDVGYHLYIEL